MGYDSLACPVLSCPGVSRERDIINNAVAVQAGAGPEDDDLNGVSVSWDQRG